MLLTNYAIKRYFIFSSHLTNASALLGEMKKYKTRMWADAQSDGATYIWQGDHHVGHWPTF